MQAAQNDSIEHDLMSNIPVNTFKSVRPPRYLWKSGWQINWFKAF
jgi:hypothetical protein